MHVRLSVAITLDAEELQVLDQAVANYRTWREEGDLPKLYGFTPSQATRETVLAYWATEGLLSRRLEQGKKPRPKSAEGAIA